MRKPIESKETNPRKTGGFFPQQKEKESCPFPRYGDWLSLSYID